MNNISVDCLGFWEVAGSVCTGYACFSGGRVRVG